MLVVYWQQPKHSLLHCTFWCCIHNKIQLGIWTKLAVVMPEMQRNRNPIFNNMPARSHAISLNQYHIVCSMKIPDTDTWKLNNYIRHVTALLVRSVQHHSKNCHLNKWLLNVSISPRYALAGWDQRVCICGFHLSELSAGITMCWQLQMKP